MEINKNDGGFDIHKFIVEKLNSNDLVKKLLTEGSILLRENCKKKHPPGTKIKYDLSYFFRWYGIDGKIPDDKIYDAMIADCAHADGTCQALFICVRLPEYVDFTKNAYELLRCKKGEDGTWLLYVVNDSKLVIS